DRNTAGPTGTKIGARRIRILRILKAELHRAAFHTWKDHAYVLHAGGIAGPYGHVFEVVRIAVPREMLRIMFDRTCRELPLERFNQHVTRGATRCQVGSTQEKSVERQDTERRSILGVVTHVELDGH